MYRKLFLLPVFWQLSQVVPEKTSNNLYRMKSTTLMNYRALTDAVSRDRSPSFSVCPISRTDTAPEYVKILRKNFLGSLAARQAVKPPAFINCSAASFRMACCWSVNFTVSFILGARCATVIPFAPYERALIA